MADRHAALRPGRNDPIGLIVILCAMAERGGRSGSPPLTRAEASGRGHGHDVWTIPIGGDDLPIALPDEPAPGRQFPALPYKRPVNLQLPGRWNALPYEAALRVLRFDPI